MIIKIYSFFRCSTFLNNGHSNFNILFIGETSMSRFSDFFKRFQPSLDEIESPGHPVPKRESSRPMRQPSNQRELSHSFSFNTDDDNSNETENSLNYLSTSKKQQEFEQLLSEAIVNLEKCRQIAWAGIPPQFRARLWRLFLDYEPISLEQAPSALEHKRKDYFDCMNRMFSEEQTNLRTSSQQQANRQISIDLPRTSKTILHDQRVNSLFHHVLFVWAVRHPASSYVQGMNDILQPFFFVFINQFYLNLTPNEIAQKSNIDDITDEQLKEVEADCFWCFSKLLDGIQDVYTKDQPGLYKMSDNLSYVLSQADPVLSNWILDQNISYTNFTIRWMGCLLVREFNMLQLYRIWDLFVAEPNRIATTQVYICAAMLSSVSKELMNCEQSDFIMKIQSLTPSFWTTEKVEYILSLSFVFENNFPLTPNQGRKP